jgi:hypothetical protein
MRQSSRPAILRRALPFSLLPAALFMPAVAFLTICPRTYSVVIMKVIAIVFVASELRALPLLLRSVEWKLGRSADWVSAVALPILIIALLVILLCTYGLVLGAFAN